MKRFLIALFCATSMVCYSQRDTVRATLYTITSSGEARFRITTDEVTVASYIHQNLERQIVYYVGRKKKDRMGEYWEMSFYFKNDDKNVVINQLKLMK